MIEDPVCSIPLDIEMAAATSEYNGKIYYFCSFECKNVFDYEPMQYVGGYDGHPKGHGCCG